MPQYRKKNVKRVPVKADFNRNALRPVQVKDMENFDPLSGIDEIVMKDSKSYRHEKKLQREKERLTKKPPAKRIGSAARAQKTKAKLQSQSSRFNVVKGRKRLNKIRNIIASAAILAIIIIIVLINYLSPTGLLELVQNSYAKIGSSGSFPVTLEGSGIVDLKSYQNSFFVLSNAFLECYNKSGNQIFLRQHGCANPVLELSSSRILVYDRGGTDVKVYNYKSELFSKKLESSIITATIGQKGNCAFATKSRGYAAQVEVVDKNFNTLFKWYSIKEMISAVALSDDGKRLAVAAVDTVNGVYKSNLYIFTYKDAKPELTYSFDDAFIVALNNKSDGLMVVTKDNISVIDWNKNEKRDILFTGNPRYVSIEYNPLTVVVSGRDDNILENSITVVGNKGTVLAQFNVSGKIKSASVFDQTVFIHKENSIEAYSFNGSKLADWDNSYSIIKINGVSKEEVLTVNNTSLEILNIHSEQS
ncbi:MAG TPA: hypothetical protein GXX17_05865 [Clostridiales bacterium]|nr:hypothetical protein [Clostridiales bacterium]